MRKQRQDGDRRWSGAQRMHAILRARFQAHKGSWDFGMPSRPDIAADDLGRGGKAEH